MIVDHITQKALPCFWFVLFVALAFFSLPISPTLHIQHKIFHCGWLYVLCVCVLFFLYIDFLFAWWHSPDILHGFLFSLYVAMPIMNDLWVELMCSSNKKKGGRKTTNSRTYTHLLLSREFSPWFLTRKKAWKWSIFACCRFLSILPLSQPLPVSSHLICFLSHPFHSILLSFSIPSIVFYCYGT